MVDRQLAGQRIFTIHFHSTKFFTIYFYLVTIALLYMIQILAKYMATIVYHKLMQAEEFLQFTFRLHFTFSHNWHVHDLAHSRWQTSDIRQLDSTYILLLAIQTVLVVVVFIELCLMPWFENWQFVIEKCQTHDERHFFNQLLTD